MVRAVSPPPEVVTAKGPDGVTIDPFARCDSDAVGAGTVIWGFAHIEAGAVVGRACKIGEHSYVEAGATIGDRVTVKNAALIWRGVHLGDDVFVGPRVTFTNDRRPRAHRRRSGDELDDTLIGPGATLGASVTVVCGVTVGHDAMVGAGSLVHRDVPAHALVVGVPAHRIGWVCRCGDRLDDQFRCGCGRRYRTADDGGLEPADVVGARAVARVGVSI